MSADIVNSWSETISGVTQITVNVGAIHSASALLAILIKDGITGTTVQPSGWILVLSVQITSSSKLEVWKKQATTSEPISYSWEGDLQDYIVTIYEIFKGDINTISIPFTSASTGTAPALPSSPNDSREGGSLRITGFVSDNDAGTKVLDPNHTLLHSITSAGGAGSVSLLSGYEYHHNDRFVYDNKISKPVNPKEFYIEYFATNVCISADGLACVASGAYIYNENYSVNYGRLYSYKRDSVSDLWSQTSLIEGHPSGGSAVNIGDGLNISDDGLTLIMMASSIDSLFTMTRTSYNSGWVIDSTWTDSILSESSKRITMSGDALTLTVVLSNQRYTVYNSSGDSYYYGEILTYQRSSVSSSWVFLGSTYFDSDLPLGIAHSTGFIICELSSDGLTGFLYGGKASSGNAIFIIKRASTSHLWYFLTDLTGSSGATNGSALGDNGYTAFKEFQDGGITKVAVWNVNPKTGLMSDSGITFTSPSFDAQDYETPSTVRSAVPKNKSNTYLGIARSINNNSEETRHLCTFYPYIKAILNSCSNSVDWLAFYIEINEKIFNSVPVITFEDSVSVVGLSPLVNPIAVDDEYDVDHGQDLIVSAPGVLSNDEYYS